MGVGDGTVIGVTRVVANGADSSQWNLVIVGDGFTSLEQSSFNDVVDDFIDVLAATAPFDSPAVWDRINVHRIEVHSDESGADNPATCSDGTVPFAGQPASTVATYFDAEYCATGLRRLLTVDTVLVMATADAWVPEWDVVLVIVNHIEPGGSGSPDVAVTHAGGVYDQTAIHELGHAAFGLADEYDYLAGCASGETTQDVYPWAWEPLEHNVTIDPLASSKWGGLAAGGTPLPTTTNPNPAVCDTQASPVAAGAIGTFDGAYHYHSGVFRPAFTCKMRVKAEPFCGVCANVITSLLIIANPCFLASAVYGDPYAPDVVTLRKWRDGCLLSDARGAEVMRRLMDLYSRVGPPLARFVQPRRHVAEALRACVFAPWARLLRRWERSS